MSQLLQWSQAKWIFSNLKAVYFKFLPGSLQECQTHLSRKFKSKTVSLTCLRTFSSFENSQSPPSWPPWLMQKEWSKVALCLLCKLLISFCKRKILVGSHSSTSQSSLNDWALESIWTVLSQIWCSLCIPFQCFDNSKSKQV